MKASELFDILKNDFLSTKPTRETLKKYKELTGQFKETEILKENHFFQVKDSPNWEGDLMLELMFFNADLVHDIGISNHRVDVITVPTQKIAKVKFTMMGKDELELKINAFGYDAHTPDLYYQTKIKRFKDLSRVRANLLGLIK